MKRRLNDTTLTEMVMALVGPITATGDRGPDTTRLKNLKVLTGLIDRLAFKVADVAKYSDSPSASEKAIGEHARGFLVDLTQAGYDLGFDGDEEAQ